MLPTRAHAFRIITMRSINTEVKDGAQSDPDSPESPQGGTVPDGGSAILGRALAALIDYVLLQAIMFACTQRFPDSDLAYYFALMLGAIYLVAGNSCVMRGQTLGKKVFGLRVLSLPFEDESPYLSLSRSFYRYLGLYGGMVLLKEVPSLLFRAYGVVAPIYLLDSYMLPALMYPIALFLSVLIHPWQRGLHDGLASSIVVRSSIEPPAGFQDEHYGLGLKKSLIIGAIAGILGSIFWTLSVVHPPQIRALYEHRFALEQQFPVRMYRADLEADGAHLHLILIGEQDGKKLATAIAEYAAPIISPIISPNAFSQATSEENVLLLSFYRQNAVSEEGKETQEAMSQRFRYSFANNTLEEVIETDQ